MAKRVLFICIVIAFVFLITGCANYARPKSIRLKKAAMVAKYTPCGITLDGKLDEVVWQNADVYQAGLSLDRQTKGGSVIEGGKVSLAWDDTNLYVAIDFIDSDIVAEGQADQMHHYKIGDVAEVFIKPAGQSSYWELCVTPMGKKTAFWYPSRGRLGLPSGFEYKCDIMVAAQCNGTLNDWTDKDVGWSAEMAIPIKVLTANGNQFGPGSNWRIFIGRYNYSRYLDNKELSMHPALPLTNFHMFEEYAILKLVR